MYLFPKASPGQDGTRYLFMHTAHVRDTARLAVLSDEVDRTLI